MRIDGVDDDVPLLDLDAPLLHRAEVGDEAERGDQRLRRAGSTVSPSTVDLDRLERRRRRVSSVTWALVMISTSDSITCCTVRSWARKASRRCTSAMDRGDAGSRCSAQSNALSPPPTMTTSLPAYGSKLGTKNSMPRPTQPSPAGSGRGLNLPMPGGDQDGPGPHLGAVVEADGHAVVVVRRASVAVRSRRYSGLAVAACSTRPSTRMRPLTRREAGDVEDLLLGVHRGDLAAELGQRVDDRDPVAAEAGVVGGEQPGRAGADDQEVGLDDRAGCAHGVDPSTFEGARSDWNVF